MIIEYKKQTQITKLLEEMIEFKKFTKSGFFEKIGFKIIKYPDLYIHTRSIDSHSKNMIKNSRHIIVNSNILKNEIVKEYNLNNKNVHVIFPINDVKKFKKSKVKKRFYEEHNIKKGTLIVYFTALNFARNGFESFCDIVSKLEANGSQVFVTCTIDKELVYAKNMIKKYNLEDKITIIKNEIFSIADIFVLPTQNKNFSLNIVKAISNKCIVFVPENNNSIELLDIFSIMDNTNDSNTSYKIDMLVRVTKEFKKIRKETYKIGKKLNNNYLINKINHIVDIIAK
jgi:glycosyltransferase involved in cell wall biosynthesis